eukprot:5276375-Amphidinium_carterae.1
MLSGTDPIFRLRLEEHAMYSFSDALCWKAPHPSMLPVAAQSGPKQPFAPSAPTGKLGRTVANPWSKGSRMGIMSMQMWIVSLLSLSLPPSLWAGGWRFMCYAGIQRESKLASVAASAGPGLSK